MLTILNHNDIPGNITDYFVFKILSSTSYLRWYLIPPMHKKWYIEKNFKTTFDGTTNIHLTKEKYLEVKSLVRNIVKKI